MSQQWPLFQSDSIVVSNLDSDVAVLTLWSDARRIAGGLDPSSFAACGNLYSNSGFGFVLRNLLANPRIRYLMLCGADLTSTAAVVLDFFAAADSNEQSIRSVNLGLSSAQTEAIRRFVRLVALVGVTDPARIAEQIAKLPRLEPWGDPILLASPDPSAAALTAEPAGFVVRHESGARAWIQLLGLAVRFGQPASRPWRGRSLSAACAVLEGEPHREDDARWFHSEGGDSSTAPDLRSIPRGSSRTVRRREGYLDSTVSLRRLDLFGDWPRVARLLRADLVQRAREASCHVGVLSVVAHELVLRERDLPAAEHVLERRAPRTLPWRADPRGLFWIKVEGRTLIVEHGTANGPTGRRWQSESSEQLCRQILNEQLVGLPAHAAYLGRELHTAEMAARLGLPYRQDVPLDLSALERPALDRSALAALR